MEPWFHVGAIPAVAPNKRNRGPYWYFHFREAGKQKTLYVGKTDAPEAILDAKMKSKED